MLISKAAQIYEQKKNVHAVSKDLGVSDWKAIKLLITAGIYPTPMAKKVKQLQDQQYPDAEICATLNIKPKTLPKYKRYSKCVYNEACTVNASRIRKWRRKKDKSQTDEMISQK